VPPGHLVHGKRVDPKTNADTVNADLLAFLKGA
jgi:hypothetical protein